MTHLFPVEIDSSYGELDTAAQQYRKKKKPPQIESSVKRGRETSRGVASLLSKMCEVEWLGQLFIGRGVSSTVYVLVHLLGHLLHVAKVGCSHSNSEEGDDVSYTRVK